MGKKKGEKLQFWKCSIFTMVGMRPFDTAETFKLKCLVLFKSIFSIEIVYLNTFIRS